jgi:hypothetical protein
MKKLRRVGAAGIIVASLATAAGPSLASASSRPELARISLQSQPRLGSQAAYLQRLDFLSRVLELSPLELEIKLSRLAHRLPIGD